MQKKTWMGRVLLVAGAAALALGAGALVSHAQGGGDTCAMVVAQTVAAVQAACSDLQAGMMCATADSVDVRASDGSLLTPAPLLPLEGIAQITAAPLSVNEGQWGLGVLRVPAIGTEAPLTAVLFGGATLVNEPGQPTAPSCSAVSLGTVNVRSEPNTESAILGQLNQGESAPITARLPDSSWWRILWRGEPAWVFAQLAPADCDPGTMLVFDPETQELSGGIPAPDFQNVRLVSDFDAPLCGDTPRGGLLLQAAGPEASWRVNDALLTLTGTVLLQAGTEDVLAIHVLEGSAVVRVGEVTRTGQAGQLLRVPLTGGTPAGVPGPALDAVLPDAATAPLTLLPRPVTPLVVNTPAVPPPDGADAACSLLPQRVVAPSDGQGGRIRVMAAADQTLRISASASVDINRLVWEMPDGSTAVIAEAAGAALAADVMATVDGVYTIEAQGVPAGTVVHFGVTCDLPRPAPLPPMQSCNQLLLDWEGVTGNSVRFSAPLGAQISIEAEHSLPGDGPARTLEVTTEDGQVVGQTAFRTFRDRQSAGPLDLLVPQDGTYVIHWDGDPFNQVDIAAICLMPELNTAP